MPLNLNILPKPEISFTQPGELVVFADTPATVEVLVTPRAVGAGQVHLKCIADEIAFRDEANQKISSEITFDFQCHDAQENQVLPLRFVLVCSDPSDQDILIRFDTWAFNAQGQKSPPIMQLKVRLKSRAANLENGETLLAALPSDTESASSDSDSTASSQDDPSHENSATS